MHRWGLPVTTNNYLMYVTQITERSAIKIYIGSELNRILESWVPMKKILYISLFYLISALAICLPATAQAPMSEYMSFDAAQPVLRGFSDALPADLGKSPDATTWSAWIKTQD